LRGDDSDEALKMKNEANEAVYKRRQIVLNVNSFGFIQLLMMLNIMLNSER